LNSEVKFGPATIPTPLDVIELTNIGADEGSGIAGTSVTL
jgi:hypothetical protein